MDFNTKLHQSSSRQIWSTLRKAKVAAKTNLKLREKWALTDGRASLDGLLLMSNGAACTSRVLPKIMSNDFTAGILAYLCE